MTTTLIGQILTLLIMLWGFSIMLRPVFGGPTGYGRRSLRGGGTGFFGRLVLGLLFSVLLPIVWWTIGLVGRAYHRTFIVFAEFVTGVHDWGTYRTSSFKYLGALFAFLGFNGMLFLLLGLLIRRAGASVPGDKLLGVLVGTVVCCAVARALMRRMP